MAGEYEALRRRHGNTLASGEGCANDDLNLILMVWPSCMAHELCRVLKKHLYVCVCLCMCVCLGVCVCVFKCVDVTWS